RGVLVSNLSSSRALRDLAERKGGHYEASAVGEVNVVSKMKEINAVIGGEGNGGIIVPDLHYGRDALIGVALILTHLAKSEKTLSELKEGYPEYHMAKMKAQLDPSTDVDAILEKIKEGVTEGTVNTIDGVKIDLKDRWVHMRKSNTEPIIRIYTEAPTAEAAKELGEEYVSRILSLM
ncbi:MAG: phosphoglucosamine mutase, partial [Bacteroidota bacterium]|nr:phosphoglucosamine mutase [Bacteroidota bacterium]